MGARPPGIPAILLEDDFDVAPTVSGPGHRFLLPHPAKGAALAPAPAALDPEFQQDYGTGRLWLVARDPLTLHASWDLASEHRELAGKRLELRVQPVGESAGRMQHMAIPAEAHSAFVHLAEAGGVYEAELGYIDTAGTWQPLARSAPASTPPQRGAAAGPVRFVTPLLEGAIQPPGGPQPAGEPPGFIPGIPHVAEASIGEANEDREPAGRTEAAPTHLKTERETLHRTDAEATAPAPEIPVPIPAYSSMPLVAEVSVPFPSAQRREERQDEQPEAGRAAVKIEAAWEPPLPTGTPAITAPEAVLVLGALGGAGALEYPQDLASPPVSTTWRVRWVETPVPAWTTASEDRMAAIMLLAAAPARPSSEEWVEGPIQAPPEAGEAAPMQEAPVNVRIPSGPGLPSSEAVLGAPSVARRGFWFNVNAELIVYGATEPDATVTIDGEPIRLRSDGSFTLRFALPDGRYALTAEAIAAAGDDRRSARLEFVRRTAYQGEVAAHPQNPQLTAPPSDPGQNT